MMDEVVQEEGADHAHAGHFEEQLTLLGEAPGGREPAQGLPPDGCFRHGHVLVEYGHDHGDAIGGLGR